MKKKHTAQSAFLTVCIVVALLVFFVGMLVTLFAAVSAETSTRESARKVDAQTRRQFLCM